MDTGAKRLIDITLDDLDNFLQERGYKKEHKVRQDEEGMLQLSDYSDEEIIRGDRSLAEYLGVSEVTVQNMKKAGRFDGCFVKNSFRRYIYIRPLIDRALMKYSSRV